MYHPAYVQDEDEEGVMQTAVPRSHRSNRYQHAYVGENEIDMEATPVHYQRSNRNYHQAYAEEDVTIESTPLHQKHQKRSNRSGMYHQPYAKEDVAIESKHIPLSRSNTRGDSWDGIERGNDSTTDNCDAAGLGINFYDDRGICRRSVINPDDLISNAQAGNNGVEGDAEDQFEYEKLLSNINTDAKVTTANDTPTIRRTPRTQQFQPHLQRQTPSTSNSPYSRTPNTNTASRFSSPTELEIQTPKLLAPLEDPDWDHDSPDILIDQYLEGHYRDQAETFTRISSRETPVRELTASSRRVSSAPRSPLGLGIASIVGTPTGSPPSGGSVRAKTSNSNDDDDDNSLERYEDGNESDSDRPTLRNEPTNIQIRGNISPASSPDLNPNPVKPPSRVQQLSQIYNQRSTSGTTPSSSEFSPLVSVSSRPTPVGTPTNAAASRLRSSAALRIPLHSKPNIIKRQDRPTFLAPDRSASAPTPSPKQPLVRGPEYFTSEERHQIAKLVHAVERNCEKHTNCKDCIDLEYAYWENKLLPLTMDPEQRQKIINNNRSLRNIKNELESLAEHGAISDDVYDTIMSALPAESSLGGAARSNPTPVQAQAVAPAPSPAPTNAFNNMRLNEPPPPAYTNPSGPPSLPTRAPSAPPAKPEIARARALFRYAEPEDCNFEPGDQIAVHEYMNNDWWLGRNLRTGKEGVFPMNYVEIIPPQGPASMHGAYGAEKTSYNAYQPHQYNQGPPPPGPSQPYNSSVPPMAIAEEPSKPGKGQEMGKKFGKKLGNAAIFGAGATIGGNIVNSIF